MKEQPKQKSRKKAHQKKVWLFSFFLYFLQTTFFPLLYVDLCFLTDEGKM